jgi:tRNA(fMet)-specific endonuclease VapC
MTVAELYEGAFRAGWGDAKILKLKETLRTYVVIPFSIDLCRHWAEIRTERRADRG